MKRFLATLITGAAWLSLAVFARSGEPPQPLDLVLPGPSERIRLLLEFQGQTPETRWNEFLQRWFAYFDRNEDGMLDSAEAARVLPLPLPSQRSVNFDFGKADANNDGKVSRAELAAFYCTAGFKPVLAVVEPVSPEDLQVADALFRHTVPGANGKLTKAGLDAANRLLRKLDENDDGVLTLAEVLSLGRHPPKISQKREFRWSSGNEQPVLATIRLIVDDAKGLAARVEPKSLSLPGGRQRVLCANQLLDFSRSGADPLHGLKNARRFVMAQFDSVADSSAQVDKSQIQEDGVFQVLHDLFVHADRDGNGKLTRAELARFLDLIEQGINAPVLVTLTDRGRNLFYHLDTDGDGRLDAQELGRAPALFSTLGIGNDWERNQVPGFAEVRLQQGFAGGSFGPLPLPAPANTAPHPSVDKKGKGPAWFQAMDRNGDGFLSPREFLGPIEVFRKLDRDGDGFINIAEAEQAGPK